MKNLLTHLELYYPKVTIRAEDDPLVETLLHRLELSQIPVEYQQVVIKDLRSVLSELAVPAVTDDAPVETPPPDDVAVKEPTPVTEKQDLAEHEVVEQAAETEEPPAAETVALLTEAITTIVAKVQEACAVSEEYGAYRATYLTTVLQTATQLMFGDAVPTSVQIDQCIVILQRTLQDMAGNYEKPEFAWVFTVEEIPTILSLAKNGLLAVVPVEEPQGADTPSATAT